MGVKTISVVLLLFILSSVKEKCYFKKMPPLEKKAVQTLHKENCRSSRTFRFSPELLYRVFLKGE